MPPIWFKKPDADYINEKLNIDTIDQHLGIIISEVGDDFIKGTMPADSRTCQPFGIVHGGASVVLAESLGSIAGCHVVDHNQYRCVGQDVSATHLRPVSAGLVSGIAKPVHLGKRSQVWQIKLSDDSDRLTCMVRLILAIIEI
jgi:1,4-dihydroxy-2-naphthoyl-CoA hydrolase